MFASVQFSSVTLASDSLLPHGLQHARLPCPSLTPRVYSNLCPSSQWCNPTMSSSVIPFSSCLQSFPASGSFPMSQFFTSDGQNIGASASSSVLLMNTQNWFPLGLTGWISLQSKGLSRVFSSFNHLIRTDSNVFFFNGWVILHCVYWMKLEPIIQSKVSQKEKHQYSILTHRYGI